MTNKPDWQEVLDMADNMEVVETFLGRKGRFVGNMVHIGIDDLAETIHTHIKTPEVQNAELVGALKLFDDGCTHEITDHDDHHYYWNPKQIKTIRKALQNAAKESK